MYRDSSTIFGSIIKSLTSSGEALNNMLMIKLLMHTLLPDPVAPATNRCGILVISAIITFPEISLPSTMAALLGCLINSVDVIISLKYTGVTLDLGISIPMASFPGIGASTLTDRAQIQCDIISQIGKTLRPYTRFRF